MEPLGPKIRRQRRRLGFTLDELAVKTRISKPYLSLIETGRVPNPPSDEKLRRIEHTLGFASNELIGQAHLLRTPKDVREMLQDLMRAERGQETGDREQERTGDPPSPLTASSSPFSALNLDRAYLTGALQQLVDRSAGNVERVATNAVPVINRVSAGYPQDFTDLAYPPRVADEFIGCPDVSDRDAFACRVHGDSMMPKYQPGDIVIFSPAAPCRPGDDCFVRFEDCQTTFKRVFFEADDSGKSVVRLQPRNEKYRPQTVDSERIAGMYRAVFRYQRVDE